MNVSVVGNRNGHAVIHWPGVLFAAFLVVTAHAVGVLAFSAAVGWFSPRSFIMLPAALSVVALAVRRGLRLPPQELPVVG